MAAALSSKVLPKTFCCYAAIMRIRVTGKHRSLWMRRPAGRRGTRLRHSVPRVIAYWRWHPSMSTKAAQARRWRTSETLTFLGFLAFEDPPKKGAGETLASLNALGVAVKIVTGDSEEVTRHVCAALGVAVAGCLTGSGACRLERRGLVRKARTNHLVLPSDPAAKIPRHRRAAPQGACRRAISATASTTRRLCGPPMSDSPWTPGSMSPRRRHA